jgi:hypothetical protein
MIVPARARLPEITSKPGMDLYSDPNAGKRF